jgi:hypothetical protein
MGFWEKEVPLGYSKELDWHMQEKQTPQIRRGGGVDTSPRIYIDLLARNDTSGICDGTTAEEICKNWKRRRQTNTFLNIKVKII